MKPQLLYALCINYASKVHNQYLCLLSLSFCYPYALFDTTKTDKCAVEGPFIKSNLLWIHQRAEFPFKGVVSLCGVCGNQWEILLSLSVNIRQTTECCDRAGALLYKQPSWRENAVTPAFLSAEGKASYCRCMASHSSTHKHCVYPVQPSHTNDH